MRCKVCGRPARLVRETESGWVFACHACGRMGFKAKIHVGGTRGAGEKDAGQTGQAGGWGYRKGRGK